MDVRVGGTSLVCMRSPEGVDFYNTWSYGRVDPPERLEFVVRFANDRGEQVNPSRLGLPADLASEVPHVVVLVADGDRTLVTVTEQGYTSDQTLEMSKLGLEQCLDKMAALVARRQ
jgi:uncharacterized protein YndB with AHSA1/START domain